MEVIDTMILICLNHSYTHTVSYIGKDYFYMIHLSIQTHQLEGSAFLPYAPFGVNAHVICLYDSTPGR